jgi:hypothetical protein
MSSPPKRVNTRMGLRRRSVWVPKRRGCAPSRDGGVTARWSCRDTRSLSAFASGSLPRSHPTPPAWSGALGTLRGGDRRCHGAEARAADLERLAVSRYCHAYSPSTRGAGASPTRSAYPGPRPSSPHPPARAGRLAQVPMMGFPIVRLLLERRSKNDATRLSRGANPGQGTSKQMEQTRPRGAVAR